MKKRTFPVVALLAFTLLAGLAGWLPAAPKYTIRFCSEATEEMPWTAVGVKFGELLNQTTNGDVVVQTFANSSLAGGGEAVDMLTVGSIEMYVDAPGVYSNIYAPLGLFEVPYTFTDLDQANRAFDSKASQGLLEDFRKASKLRVLGGLCHGFIQTITNKPIKTMADFKGLKIRVAPVPMCLAMWQTFGAKSTPVEYSELYTSLATGVVDALDNPLFVVDMGKFYEVLKYVNLTDHQALFAMWVVNDKFFQSLPADYQRKAYEAMGKAVAWGRTEVARQESGYIDKLKANGMQVINTEKSALMAATKDLHKTFLDASTDKIYLQIRNVK